MGISGSLRDVSVHDVMQFIHLGRRSGTLMLTRGEERAVLGFHRGQLVSAQAPGTPKIGDLLVDSGRLERDTLRRAVELQSHDPERRSLGHILIAGGVIAATDLRRVIERQIEQAVAEVVGWENGAFDFALDDLRPIDDIALRPGELLPDVDLDTQMVLAQAARLFDERDRPAGPAAAGDEEEPAADLWAELGVSAPPAGRRSEPPETGVERLRRVFAELRHGLVTATVALNLMRVISESFERAVLFLVQREHLAVLGAFGADAEGRPLAERLRGLRLPLHGDDALGRCVRLGRIQTTGFAAAALREPFRSLVGRPATGQLVVFPVAGAQRVIAAVYADNGERLAPIENLEVLELATAQVGIAFENELLRRGLPPAK